MGMIHHKTFFNGYRPKFFLALEHSMYAVDALYTFGYVSCTNDLLSVPTSFFPQCDLFDQSLHSEDCIIAL